jgi:hypothetical protein
MSYFSDEPHKDTTPSSPPTSGSENTHSGSHSKSNSLSSLSSTRTGSSGSGVRIPLSVLSSPSYKSEARDDAEEPDAGKQNTEEDDHEEVPASDSEGSQSEDGNGDDDDDDEDEEFEEDDSDSDSQPPTPDLRYDEPTLLSAERLLSRTLALANADPDKGMAAEICASHPCWFLHFIILLTTMEIPHFTPAQNHSTHPNPHPPACTTPVLPPNVDPKTEPEQSHGRHSRVIRRAGDNTVSSK